MTAPATSCAALRPSIAVGKRCLRQPILAILLAASLTVAEAVAGQPAAPAAAPAVPWVKGQLPAQLQRVSYESLRPAELLALASLQGLLAKDSPVNLYLDDGHSGYGLWLDLFRGSQGVEITKAAPFRDILARFQGQISGYVLCRVGDPRSVAIAVSLAGPSRGVVVDESLQSIAESLGWRLLHDARDKDYAWLDSVRPATARFDVLLTQPKELPWQMRDYAVLADAQQIPAWHSPEETDRFHSLVDRNPQARLLGWGDNESEEELAFIGRSSRAGLPLIPANHVRNLSVLSSLPARGALKQNAPQSVRTDQAPARVHTATFVFTDGDNLSWLLFDFPTDRRWFGSPDRGKIPLGWGMAPAMAELTPGIVEWYYRHASSAAQAREVFVAGPSGNGYFFPSLLPPAALARHCGELDHLMALADLRLVQVIDSAALDRTDVWSAYLSQPHIDGLIYCDYAPYDKEHGRITWANGKPVVSAAGKLWGGAKDSGPDAIAARLNRAPRNPRSARGYSLIVVHAWTHTVADVVALAGQLDPAVEVVAPDEFFRRIRTHLGPKNRR